MQSSDTMCNYLYSKCPFPISRGVTSFTIASVSLYFRKCTGNTGKRLLTNTTCHWCTICFTLLRKPTLTTLAFWHSYYSTTTVLVKNRLNFLTNSCIISYLTSLNFCLTCSLSFHSERCPKLTSSCRKQLCVKPVPKCVFSSSLRSCWTGPTALRNSSRSSAAVTPLLMAAWDTAACRDPNLMDGRYSHKEKNPM